MTMASNYQVSPLDSNKSILMVLKDIQKYLNDNPIYKVYFCNTNFIPNTLVYNLSDVDTIGLSSGDVVFFKNIYYAKVESVGDSTFTILEAVFFKGAKGDKGDTGAQGIQGAKGDKGDTGAQGIQGEKGVKGDKGDTGAQGIQGEQGIQGVKGDKGDKGDTGDNGVSITNVTASQSGTTITLTFAYSNGTTSTASYTATGSGIELNTYTKTFNSISELDSYIRANIDKIHKITYTPNVNIDTNELKYITMGETSYSGGTRTDTSSLFIANLHYEFTPHLAFEESVGDNSYILLKYSAEVDNMVVRLYPVSNNVTISYNSISDMIIYSRIPESLTFTNGTFKFVILGAETNPQ